jgi:hypothetical protein
MTMDITKAIKRIPRHVFYRHYKGSTYRVLCVSLRENDAEPVVTYENEVGVVFTRPVADWEELIDHDGRFIQRFVRLPAHVEPSVWPPRDDFETFDTPETRLRQQLSEAHAAMKAREDSQFLDKLRAMGIPVPRMSMKDAAAALGFNFEELKTQFEAELELPQDSTPVPLKMWMAAAGVDPRKIVEDLQNDTDKSSQEKS